MSGGHTEPNWQSKRASRKTSGTDGMTPPVPGTGRRSSKDTAKARAAEHASIALHRRINAALTLPCKMNGEDSARALSRAARKVAVSSLHRPLRLPKQPTVPDPLHQRVLGTCAPSGAWQLPVQHRHCLQPSSWRFRRCAEERPRWCRWPAGLHATRKARQPRLRVGGRRQR